jgi:hypothetical protein
MSKKKPAAASAVANQEVDEFLNENSEIQSEETIEEIDTEGLDLSQIPPPEPDLAEDRFQNPIITNVAKETVGAPKAKPGAVERQVLRFSRFGKSKRPITTDLSDGMLPPVTRKRTAIYQLLGTDDAGRTIDKRIDPGESAAANIVDVSDFEMHHTYSIFDVFEPDFGRKNKVVTYYDGVQRVNYKDPVTGEMRPDIRQKVGIPRFVRGQAIVDITKNYHQFLWWELHPRNKNNRFRDRSIAPLFERVDIKHYNPHTQLLNTELKLDAMTYVRKLNANQAIDLAAALNIPTFRVQPGDVKAALYVAAETDPKSILFKAPDQAVSATITVMRGMDLGIIDYDANRKQFYFGDNDKQPIYQVPLDEQPVKSLAQYLSEDSDEGGKLLETIQEFINYWQE